MSNIRVDIGELCTHCFEDTSFSAGNGKRVNRIPSDADAKIVSDNTENTIHITISGYMCPECRLIDCDTCGNPTLETEVTPQGTVVCAGCMETLDDMDQLEIQEDWSIMNQEGGNE